jgi:hypothetical protein
MSHRVKKARIGYTCFIPGCRKNENYNNPFMKIPPEGTDIGGKWFEAIKKVNAERLER